MIVFFINSNECRLIIVCNPFFILMQLIILIFFCYLLPIGALLIVFLAMSLISSTTNSNTVYLVNDVH